MTEVNAKQLQLHEILFNREIGWQEIIYDLINTEQLNPWDVDIILLTNKYLAKIQELEEADFFISSKVLLAASLLLRIKSEILLNKYIKSIDEILFGKKEKIASKLERIEIDEKIPELIPRSPLPRFKKVTLNELIESLNKAIITENRRIKKEIIKNNAFRESSLSLPVRKISIKDKIKLLFTRIIQHFNENKSDLNIHYDIIIGNNKEDKVSSLVPLLHLEHQNKIWLHQKDHFGDIHIWKRDDFFKNHPDYYKDIDLMNTNDETSP